MVSFRGVRAFQVVAVGIVIGTATVSVGVVAVDVAVMKAEQDAQPSIAQMLIIGTIPPVVSDAQAAATPFPATHTLTVSGVIAPEIFSAPVRVLTIGDSVMKGFGLPPASAWPEVLANRHGWKLTSLACDGAGFLAIGSSQECNTTFYGVAAEAANLRPDLIVIEGSSNDYGRDNRVLAAATTKTLALLRTQCPNAHIIGLSAIWTDTLPGDQISAINDQMASAVTAVGGTYLDVGQPLSGHRDLMQRDNVHPSLAGQKVLAGSVRTAANLRLEGEKRKLLTSTPPAAAP